MPGWIRRVARMATIKISVMLSWCSLGAFASVYQLSLPMLNDVIITNGLKNSCANCYTHGCVVHADSPSLFPSFIEEIANPLESASAVFLALSYARYNLSDDIVYNGKYQSIPPDLSSLTKSQPSYLVHGINLTNSFIRTFTFAAFPPLSTNGLHCTLVSFFLSRSYLPETHVFSLYVNDMTGKVGLSVQESSGFMNFLSKTPTRYPFLDKRECQAQIEFCNRINQRRFSSYNHSSWQLPFSIGTNAVIHTGSEVTVDAEGL